MTTILPALAVLFAAFCIWLTVRIVNRRERWAKWTAIGVAVTLAYPLSFGPACWVNNRTGAFGGMIAVVYEPITSKMWHRSTFWSRPTQLQIFISKTVAAYAELGTSGDTLFAFTEDGPLWGSQLIDY